jgi:vanillate O-demethylase ferredoxin subunit
MTAQLQSQQSEFFLHYCTRSPERTAFRERVEALADAGRAAIHHDGGEPSRGLDLAALLRQHEAGTHVYYCGPAGFMQAAGAAAAHWPPGSVHAEHFTAPVAGAAPPPQAPSSAFRIRLARSGLDLEVPADKSIVDVLREHDVFIETSCTQGYCGTCLTRYVAGEPEHRDTVLDDDDRKVFVLVCCARARTPTLELDL